MLALRVLRLSGFFNSVPLMKTVSSVVYVGGNLKHVCVFFRYLVFDTCTSFTSYFFAQVVNRPTYSYFDIKLNYM